MREAGAVHCLFGVIIPDPALCEEGSIIGNIVSMGYLTLPFLCVIQLILALQKACYHVRVVLLPASLVRKQTTYKRIS